MGGGPISLGSGGGLGVQPSILHALGGQDCPHCHPHPHLPLARLNTSPFQLRKGNVGREARQAMNHFGPHPCSLLRRGYFGRPRCGVRRVVCGVRCVVYGVRCAVRGARRMVCGVWCAVCGAWCAGCGGPCVVCCVRCVVFGACAEAALRRSNGWAGAMTCFSSG